MDINRNGLQILVVEDYADCAESMATVLRLYGHGVEVASDGEAALALAARRVPDVVILDIGLPKVDGYEVARRLSGPRPARTPLIIVVSGFQPDEKLAVGVHLHMVKPISPEALQAVLERFQKLLNSTLD